MSYEYAADESCLLIDVCDDCCSSGGNGIGPNSFLSQIYNVIADLDPYHPTIGALNCGDTWRFTDVSSYIPSGANLSEPTIPFGVQPMTQLSLDIVMVENCERATYIVSCLTMH